MKYTHARHVYDVETHGLGSRDKYDLSISGVEEYLRLYCAETRFPPECSKKTGTVTQ